MLRRINASLYIIGALLVLLGSLILITGPIGCTNGKLDLSQVFPPPSTQPVTLQTVLDDAQRDLTEIKLAVDIAHAAGAFKDAAQWAKIQSFEAAAQSQLNLLASAIQDVSTPTPDLIALEQKVLDAINAYKSQAGK